MRKKILTNKTVIPLCCKIEIRIILFLFYQIIAVITKYKLLTIPPTTTYMNIYIGLYKMYLYPIEKYLVSRFSLSFYKLINSSLTMLTYKMSLCFLQVYCTYFNNGPIQHLNEFALAIIILLTCWMFCSFFDHEFSDCSPTTTCIWKIQNNVKFHNYV